MSIRVADDGSHHWLNTCPCPDCLAKRDRTAPQHNFPILNLSPQVAYFFGLIKRRSRSGSVAKELQAKRDNL